MNNSTTKKIAICGYGVMGSAIAKILRENMPDAKFTIIEQSETARNAAKAAKFDSIADPNRQFGTWQFDAYWLCVKPQELPELIKSLAARTRLENSLIISIAAGVSLKQLAQWIYSNQHEQQRRSLRLVRVMPNLGLKLQAGAGALSWHTDDSADDWRVTRKYARVTRRLSQLGLNIWECFWKLRNRYWTLSRRSQALVRHLSSVCWKRLPMPV